MPHMETASDFRAEGDKRGSHGPGLSWISIFSAGRWQPDEDLHSRRNQDARSEVRMMEGATATS